MVKGISADKDEFSDWFTQIMLKADLADYSSVSGCIIYKPTSYALWENLRDEVDKRFKKMGVQNVYFPLFIPEKNFGKLKDHTEGFAPEVAWVTEAGGSKLSERLAVRPTSEAIMYESYAKWIRSWRDLPLIYNQWNNVVRWEFKHPVPFLRGREFLWNEGHSVYATKKEAEAEMPKIIGIYKDVCEKYLALPSLIGKKSDKEKFAGADYTVSMEFFMPNGKAIQGPDWHHDAQHFSKAYGISFLNKEGKKEFAYQNTWAITTRMLGVMFAVHSDAKGLILPPKIARDKVVIVPILFEESKAKVLEKAREIAKSLGSGVLLDDREEYKPGHKFAEWELKGIPIRIEIGPKDLESKKVNVIRRDTGNKEVVSIKDLKNKVSSMLEDMQESMFKKAQNLLFNGIVEVDSLVKLEKVLKDKKITLAPHCGVVGCEDELKAKTGAKVLNIPDKQPSKKSNCIVCSNESKYWCYVGKSY